MSKKKLKTLEEYNDQRFQYYDIQLKSPLNGIACPTCGEELRDTSPNTVLPSLPPKKDVHCPACDYKGYRIA